jgi:hypothetical protein
MLQMAQLLLGLQLYVWAVADVSRLHHSCAHVARLVAALL